MENGSDHQQDFAIGFKRDPSDPKKITATVFTPPGHAQHLTIAGAVSTPQAPDVKKPTDVVWQGEYRIPQDVRGECWIFHFGRWYFVC